MKALTSAAAKKRLLAFEREWMNPLLKEMRPKKYTAATDYPDSPFVIEGAMQGMYALHAYLLLVASEMEQER